MSNVEHERARRFTIIGLVVVIVFDAALVGLFVWLTYFGNLPPWISFVSIVVGVPSIVVFWWSQKKRWPAKQV
jgi:hypothetical protein